MTVMTFGESLLIGFMGDVLEEVELQMRRDAVCADEKLQAEYLEGCAHGLRAAQWVVEGAHEAMKR